MRILGVLFLLLFPFLSRAQAQLGATVDEIKATYPSNTWEADYTIEGVEYITTQMPLGKFVYYIDKETKRSYLCAQIVSEVDYVKTQIEVYDKKYIPVSDASWKAETDNGGVMYIDLKYDDEAEMYVFYYTTA